MGRLDFVLLLVVLASALYLVHTQYESRRLYVELEKAAAQSRKLETEGERLQVEKRAEATPLKVEKLARDRLQMRTTTPAVTEYVRYRAAVAALPAGQKAQP
ncbi:MAG: cell division protein FtsL [Polaromonas sp.]|nr:cell division protein FtsL [Polaromonas sp.]